VIVYFWWRATGHTVSSQASSVDLAVGNLTGLLGTYAVLWQLVLLSRLTFLEDAFGMEQLTWLHKWNGYSALILLSLHTVYLTLGFGLLNRLGIVAQLRDFLVNWEDVLKATVGMLMLIFIVLISIGIARRRFKYETWYYVHIFTYLAILLAFSHQLSVGMDLAGQPAFKVYWYALYVVSVGAILLWRFAGPLYLFNKHRFRVEKLVPEGGGVTSVYVSGRKLDEFHYRPGQFLIWRFMTPGRWWQAHPFSISVAPGGRHLRLSAKAVGDFTGALPQLVPGSYVIVDGPHGNFTLGRTTNPKLLMIAGGSGITPLRAILESLPEGGPPPVLLHAVRTRADMVLHTEIEQLMRAHHGTVKYVLSDEDAPGFAHGILDAAMISRLVPDAASREVLLCGPPGMMDAVSATLESLGVARKTIHTERFAY
jgi:predicted ferric reductase